MKKRLLPCIFLLICLEAHAQLGFTVATTFNSSPEWQVVVENYVTHRHSRFLRYGTTAVVDYTFQTKNEAVRFQPAFQFMRTTAWYYPHYFELSTAGLQGNLSIALLPGRKPTGKFPFRPFLQLSPGLDWMHKRYDHPLANEGEPFTGNYERLHDRSLAFNVGANILFEFKLTRLLSLSPEAGIRFYPHLRWKNFTGSVSEGKMVTNFDTTLWRQFLVGIRMGLNLDGEAR